MQRTPFTIILVIACLLATTLAAHDEQSSSKEKVKLLSQQSIAEKVDGKATTATTVQVTLQPGESGTPHRHPGPVFGCVLEGQYDWAIDDQPAKTLQTGDNFYEPTGCLHRVSKNPSSKGVTRVLAVVLHPSDVNEIVIPEKAQK